jgi:hypothetical protein
VSQSLAPNLAEALAQAVALHRQGDLASAEKIYARILKAHRDNWAANATSSTAAKGSLPPSLRS